MKGGREIPCTGLAPWKGSGKGVVLQSRVVFGQDREGITSFGSQTGLNVRVQKSYFKVGRETEAQSG